MAGAMIHVYIVQRRNSGRHKARNFSILVDPLQKKSGKSASLYIYIYKFKVVKFFLLFMTISLRNVFGDLSHSAMASCVYFIDNHLFFVQVKSQHEMENSFIFKFSGGNAGANF